MAAHIAYIGLGSNLGDLRQHLLTAYADMQQIGGCEGLGLSPLYRSRAVGPGEQPDYLNAVAKLSTHLAPEALLDELQSIENRHQRLRQKRWGPRTLDLDLLLFDNCVIATQRLSVPHPYLTERNFVLVPLLDLAPELHLPDGRALRTLAEQHGRAGLQRID